jgi:CIC family chloride channel protein
VLERVRVDEVMVDAPVTVRLATTLAQLAALIDKTQHRGYPVLNDEDVLVGMISFQHLMSARVRWSNWEAHRVGDIYDRVLVTAYPDESVSVALQRMGSYDVSRLPVVARDAPSRLLGIVHRSDVGAAYQQALVYLGDRGREVQGRQAGERDASETVDLVVAAGAPAAGAPIRATPWPPGCLIVAVHRGDEVLVGRGDVVIEPGDRLTVYAREGSVPELAMLLRTEESGQQRPVD